MTMDRRTLETALKVLAAGDTVKLAEIERIGTKITVPAELSLFDAMEILYQQAQAEETVTDYSATFDAAPWDGAIALAQALREKFGWARMVPTPGFWGSSPPEFREIQTSPTESVKVPWGSFQIKLWDNGELSTSSTLVDGRVVFHLSGSFKRKFETHWDALIALMRQKLAQDSIYRGKVLRVRFRALVADHRQDIDAGDLLPLPEVKFFDVSEVDPAGLIFSDDLETAVSVNMFTPLERTLEVRAAGIPLKRGILLAGPYGTGKTLAARVMARKAEINGWTFIYCERANELPDAIRFALAYQPAVVFAEDIDQVATYGARDLDTDAVLNVIDGLDTKSTELVTVLTTNDVERIEPALLRPGRLDAVLNVGPPDAKAAERLIRYYAADLLPHDVNLTESGLALAGQIPAVIRECVERAKLHAINLDGGAILRLSDVAISQAAATMRMHWSLLAPPPRDDRADIVKAASEVATAIVAASNGSR